MALTQAQIDLWDSISEEDLDREQALEPDQSKENINAAIQVDPDEYNRKRELSEKTGVPVDGIGDNEDRIRRQAEIDEERLTLDNWDTFATESPGLKKYLEEPAHAIISRDDLDNLRRLEQEASGKAWYEVDSSVFEGLGTSAVIGMGKTADAMGLAAVSETKELFTGARPELWDYATDPLGSFNKSITGWVAPAVMRLLADEKDIAQAVEQLEQREAYFTESIRVADQEIAKFTPHDQSLLEEGIRGGAQMIADMAPGLAISVASRGKINPTLYMLTAKTGLDSYGSARVDGLEHADAMRYGKIDAALEFATERLPTKQLESLLGVGEAGIKTTVKKWLAGEALGEQVATATQSLNAYMHHLDDELAQAKDFSEIMEIQSRRQAVTFISTLTGGGSMGATIRTVDYFANRERRAMGKLLQRSHKKLGSMQEQTRLDNIISLAQSSKTNERNAEFMRDFLETAAPDQRIYLNAEIAEQIADLAPNLAEQLDGSGGDIVMGMDQFVTEFVNDEARLDLVRNHIKTAEGLETQAEMEADTDSAYIKDLLTRAAESQEIKSEADLIFEEVKSNLIATGRLAEKTANQAATLIPAVVATHAAELRKAGVTNEDGSPVTVAQLYEDWNLSIIGPAQEIDISDVDYAAQLASQAEISPTGTVTAPDGRTYFKDPGYPEYEMVMVDAQLLEEIWPESEKIGAGPGYRNQISNRMQQWEKFLKQTDSGVFTMPDGREISLPDVELNVGNAHVNPPVPGVKEYGGYISFGDGRHRARWMLEQGWEKIPITMSRESFDALQQIIERRGISPEPRVLRQQNFGDTQITETVVDEFGEAMEITRPANDMWKEQQRRLSNLEALRNCVRG